MRPLPTIRIVRAAVLAAVFLGSATVQAAESDPQGWLQVTATGPVHGRLLGFLELQPRFGEDPQDDDFDLRSVLARGALGWQIRDGWSLWMGYGYTPVYDPDRDESRIFQQSLVDWRWGPFAAQNRTRLEQRFLEHEADVSWRVRSQLRLVYPLPKYPAWALVAADEVFFDLNTVTDGPKAGFDQNRLYLGVSHQLTPWLRVELDYLNQVVDGDRGSSNVVRHSGFLQFAFNW